MYIIFLKFDRYKRHGHTREAPSQTLGSLAIITIVSLQSAHGLSHASDVPLRCYQRGMQTHCAGCPFARPLPAAPGKKLRGVIAGVSSVSRPIRLCETAG